MKIASFDFKVKSKTLALSLFIITISAIYAQQSPPPADDFFNSPATEPPAGFLAQLPAADPATDPAAAGPGSQPAPASQPSPAVGGVAALNGFSDTAWNTPYSQIQQKFIDLASSETSAEKVEILRAERNKYLLVKRNDVVYRYNFYKTPYNVQLLTNHDLTEEAFDGEEGILFHVKITPLLIAASMIEERLEASYGRRTKTTVDKKTKEGVNIWELQGGLIFQWSEPYKGTPYTRMMDYMSLETAERILKDQADYFDAAEKKILQQIIFR
jgi:hypothetical protein